MKHTYGPTCLSCAQKLEGVVEYMRDWFWKKKSQHFDLHVSWGYRGKEDQDRAFAQGATKAKHPKSPHNRTNPETGEPESHAIDLFQQTIEGRGVWDPIFFAKLDAENIESKVSIICGIHFKSLGDSNHFQYHEAE